MRGSNLSDLTEKIFGAFDWWSLECLTVCVSCFFNNILYLFYFSGIKLCDVYNAALEHVGKQKADLQNSFVKNVG